MSDSGSDTLTGRGVTVTIKYSKGYESPWIVFRGTPSEVIEDLGATFGIDTEGLTLSEVVHNATAQAHRMNNLGDRLGAVSVSAGASTGSDPWASVDDPEPEKPAADPNAVHYAGIEAAQNRQELQTYWAKNQAAFANPELMAAYKARGKALAA